jgi:FkbM family methyltransferase
VSDALNNALSLLQQVINFPFELLGLKICKIEYGDMKCIVTIDALEEIEANLFYNQYMVLRKIQRGDVIVDLGTHQGTFTILASKLCGENGLVIAVEPLPLNFNLLVNNVKLNGCKNVWTFRRAVYVESGKRITLHLPTGLITLSESASVFIRGCLPRKKMRYVHVQTMSMRDIFDLIRSVKGISHLDFLKIDIEGYELLLLTSNNEWLQHVSFIIGEFHDDVYGELGKKKIIEALRRQGFKAGTVTMQIDKISLLKKWLLSSIQASATGYCLWRALTCIKPSTLTLRLFYGERS